MREGAEGKEPFEVGMAAPIRGTDKAILFDIDGVERWIPKSVIHEDSELWEVGQSPGLLVVKLWFAEKCGWC